MKELLNDQIRFAIPIDIEKGKNAKGDSVYIFKGLASTTDSDNQGETLLAKQFILDNFKQVNWNHKGKDDPGAVLGEIHKHSFDHKGLNVEGELYPEMPMAQSTITLMKALKKRGKKLQLSVEGQVLERGSKDKNHPAYKKILKANLTGVALTPNAVNQNTFADLIEKGETINDWAFDTETEELVKAMEAGTLTGTDTTDKASNGPALKEEAMEVNKKHDIKNCKIENCLICKSAGDKKVLSKSYLYEQIFSYFYNVDINKATQIYQLAEKLLHMEKGKTISQETLNKAFEIIELASKEVNKDNEKTLDQAVDLIKSDDFDDLEKSEVIEKLEKAGFKKEMAEEAAEKETPKKKKKEEKKDKKDDKKKKDEDDEDEEGEHKKEEMKKSLDILTMKTEEFQSNSDIKLGAIGVILKAQSEVIERLEKSNEALTEALTEIKTNTEKLVKTPLYKGHLDLNGLERFEKSEDGIATFNLKNKLQRKALSDKIENLAGKPGSDKFDEELYKAAQDIELLHIVGNRKTVQYLADVHKIKIVNGVE